MTNRKKHGSYAHTCVPGPCSGMTVKRTWSSSSRIQTTLPSRESDDVNSVKLKSTLIIYLYGMKKAILEKVPMFVMEALNLIANGFSGAGSLRR